MRRVLFIALLLTGCVQEEEREIVVPDSTMIVVLADLHLADARARLPDQAIGLRDSVLAYHGLDSTTFELAMDGLLDYPQELTRLYDSVLDRLNAARSMQ
ncbi:MAG: DUF4296 domain-containing protein [Rhodothermales bacterium]|nr:DUF4296 domain-containing protein [Rhodothermales bacterium]